jgi:hypothetical protein
MRHHMQRKAPLQDVDGHAVAHVTKTDKADMNSAVRHTRYLRSSRQPATEKQFIMDPLVACRAAERTRLPTESV